MSAPTHADIDAAATAYREATQRYEDATAQVATASEAYGAALSDADQAREEARTARQELLVLVGALEPEDLGLDTNLD